MSVDLEKLEKILRREAADHYQDRLVFKGLAAFISNWTRDSLKKTPTAEESRLIELVADELIEYGAMTVPQRSQAVQRVLEKVAVLAPPIPKSGAVPPPATPAKPTSPAKPSGSSPAKANSGLTSAKRVTTVRQQPPEADPPLPPPVETQKKEITINGLTISAAVRPTGSFDLEAVSKPVPPVPPLASAKSTAPLVPAKPAAPAKPPAKVLDLNAPITVAKGVGDTYARLLTYLGLHTIHDALYHFPFRYDDFSSFKKINALMYGQTESVLVEIVDKVTVRSARGREMIEVTVADETGRLKCLFFNLRMTYGLKIGAKVVLSGKVDLWANQICFKSPSYEPADKELVSTGRLVPVYSVAGPLKVATLRKLLKSIVDIYAPHLPEYLPEAIRQRHNFIGIAQAVKDLHFPANYGVREIARRRLAFDEFLLIQLGVALKRFEWQEKQPGVAIPVDEAISQAWYESLVFRRIETDPETNEPVEKFVPMHLTSAQQRAIADILVDIQKDTPMNRLLQGDVGSGKTVVGASALLQAVAAGFQGALMAPTQILAEQHFQGLRRLFDLFENHPIAQQRGLKIRLELLTGSVRKKDAVYNRIKNGEVDIIIGTSAIIEEVVAFHKLGLVIIDEQHRFGVLQRKSLRGKGAVSGANPHLLVMTATPIPRSLNLTIYGDLDLSLMNEMPPGRLDIKTRWVKPNERKAAYNFIRKQIAAGRQGFIICPLVEESEKIEAKAAVEEHERLQREVFPDLRLGLLHGRMKPAEKDQIMHDFRDRHYNILVATSVIEVGIDIPNATVILIEGANRFGLSQLHQFRGRVGRGQHQSYCLLLATDESSQTGDERLKAIERTNDGFELAEIDLAMRGPGDFFGTRQSGVPNLRVAGTKDMELMELARKEATILFNEDPGLNLPQHKGLIEKVERLWNFQGDLS